MTAPARVDGSPPGLDLARLDAYLRTTAPELTGPGLSARLLAGGRSNLTYAVRTATTDYVLRRPPLGHVLATAHDMAREYRVIAALAETPVPVPAALLLCPDAEVLGAPFYLMARVPGTVYQRRSQTDRLDPAARHRLAFDMVETLAALHAVEPEKVGLADFGHPVGFLARQLRRWTGQLDRSRSRDLPGIDHLRDRLAATVPASDTTGGRAAIVHGDFRLDNLLVDPQTMRITAVLDWEMATLGDPLTDLGLLMAYWEGLDPGAPAEENPITDALGPAAGFPSGAELVDRYAEHSTVDIAALPWYLGLACYKLAVILEGIHYRYTAGQTVGEGFERIGALVLPLIEHGLDVTREV
jgi:aminoglycoside phosphotransferase (APT) family kinase protein